MHLQITVNTVVIWLTSAFIPSTEQCFTEFTLDFYYIGAKLAMMCISFPKRHSLTLFHWPRAPMEQLYSGAFAASVQNLRSIWKTRDDQFIHCRIVEETRQLGLLRRHTALERHVGSHHTSWEQGQHQKSIEDLWATRTNAESRWGGIRKPQLPLKERLLHFKRKIEPQQWEAQNVL